MRGIDGRSHRHVRTQHVGQWPRNVSKVQDLELARGDTAQNLHELCFHWNKSVRIDGGRRDHNARRQASAHAKFQHLHRKSVVVFARHSQHNENGRPPGRAEFRKHCYQIVSA